ncbi:uncharacterized protein BDV14DRAFT_188032 [Aspergillus stella-maris]|uniref:uncharacterized protein n=1 Tax=Aspergillus stella-maris TaxID=1810926 RepID=UPI003CCCF704
MHSFSISSPSTESNKNKHKDKQKENHKESLRSTCASSASTWGISVETLQQLNPGITCPDLDTSQLYCVIGTTTTTTTTTTTETAPSNSPTMPGIAENCDSFYMVSSGGQCGTIASAHGIIVTQLQSWNSEINNYYYICVPVPGATTRSGGSASEPTDSGPSPQMPGIVDSRVKYYLIEDGESCWSIYTKAGIMLAQFRQWNMVIDAGCTNLWLGASQDIWGS